MSRRLLALALTLALAAVLAGPVLGAFGRPATPAGAASAARVEADPSSACGDEPVVAAGETDEAVDSGGTTYTYVRNVPPDHDGTMPLPVVVDFHGYSEGSSIHTLMTMLGAKGDSAGFVTITPQGRGAPAMWDPSLDGRDVAFVGDLLDQVESTLCVDTNRIYVTGLSNGAFMTSAVACAYADRVAAVAPVAGIADIEGCDPARPVPVVAFHGTADTFLSFDGGLGSAAMDLPASDGSGRTVADRIAADPDMPRLSELSVPAVVRAWAKRNDCARRPVRKTIGSDVVRVRYRCPGRATVELYRVEGGGHAWPGSAFSKSIASVVGVTTDTIVANDVMWKFFRRHPLGTS